MASPGVLTPWSAGVLIGDVAHLVVFLPLSSPLEPQLKIRLTAQSPGGQTAKRGRGEQAPIECLLGARRFRGISSLSLGREGLSSHLHVGKLRLGNDATH